MPRIVGNGTFVNATEEIVTDLVNVGWIVPAFDEDNEPLVDSYAIDADLLDKWEDLTCMEARALHPYIKLLATPLKTLTDSEIVDLINYALSAPTWSSSFLEDIAEIVRASGQRGEVRGAMWARH